MYNWSRKFSVIGITSVDDVLADLSEGFLQEMTSLAQHGLNQATGSLASHPRRRWPIAGTVVKFSFRKS